MISLRDVVACALLVVPAMGCKDQPKPGAAPAPVTKPGDSPAGGTAAPTVDGTAAAQPELTATFAGKPMAPLYGVAQADPSKGQSHRLTFSTRPLTCATLTTALDGAAPGESFWIRAHEALRPDGTTVWAYGGAAAGAGGSAPAGLVAMGAYAIEATRITGALPAGVAVEDAAFAVSGRFAVPICAPLPVPMLREVADRTREAVPVEAQGSTARATIAGKSFDVKGATAIAGPDGTWEVRLTAQPHGCADEVPGDLVVGLRVGGAEPKIYLGGNWIAGAAEVTSLGGSLKVAATPSAAAVALTLAGEMDYVPVDAAYRVALTGAVTATVCTRG